MRFVRNAAVLILAASGRRAGRSTCKQPSGGKAPAGDPTVTATHQRRRGRAERRESGGRRNRVGKGRARRAARQPVPQRHPAAQPGDPRPGDAAFPRRRQGDPQAIGDRVEKGDLLAKIESNQSLTVYELRAPLAGTVIDRQIALGEHVGEQKPAFTIADLSTVWVDFSVYRRDLKRVKVGDTVMIDPEDGGPAIEAKISYVSPVGNSDTQSGARARGREQRGLRLRPGLFVTGRLLLAAKPVNIAVKSSALQTVENRTVVFVRIGDKFEARDVEIGERDPEHVEITSACSKATSTPPRTASSSRRSSRRGRPPMSTDRDRVSARITPSGTST